MARVSSLKSTTADFTITGTTKNIEFDVSRNSLHFLDDAVLAIGGATTEVGDVTFTHDGSDFLLDAAIADEGFLIGDATTGFDVDVRFEGAGSIFIDYDGDYLAFTDDMDLRFGTGGGTKNGDCQISSTSANLLTIGQVVADTGTIAVGVTGAGIDWTFFGEGTGASLKWDGTGADQLILTGIDNSGTLFVITGVDASGDSDTVTIAHAGSGSGIAITNSSTDSVAITALANAAQTTSSVIVDGATGAADWDGADDVGMLHLTSDTAQVNAGASLLQVRHITAQPVSGAEGFLARFVSTGTARTNASAVEIEVPATQPALALNGVMAVTGQNNIAAVLVQIVGNDAGGNQDAMTINNEGTGDGLQITCDDADTVALNLVAAASQTTSLATLDGTTGSWLGASNVGMLNLTNDGTLANVNASLLFINNTGIPADDSRGSSLRIVDTGNAAAGTAGYAVYVSATDATVEAMFIDDGKVLIDESLRATLGVQFGVGETLTAAAGEGAGQQVDDDISVGDVTAGNATDFITLPNDPAVGTIVTILCNIGNNFEIRTLAAGNDTINNIDTSDGAVEYLATDTDTIVFTFTKANTWIGVSYTNLGAVRTAVIPD